MELIRALATLAEPPTPETHRLAVTLKLPPPPPLADYADLFTFQLYPFASVYVGEEGMLGGDARDRVAGFWRALHLEPPSEPDHLCVLLAFYAKLCEMHENEAEPTRRLILERSRHAFWWEHVASWIFVYLDKVEAIAGAFYGEWARLLGAAVAAEYSGEGDSERLPLHLRVAPALPDPREAGAEEFLAGLLAPVRSGVLLVRDDLARAARELGLGLRRAERRFVIRALLGQDGEAVLGWLEREAQMWSQRHRNMPCMPAPIRDFWGGRAEATAILLKSLAASSKQGTFAK